jgi:hypothetical protein
MGYIRHDAIVVTGEDYESRAYMTEAHAKAQGVFAGSNVYVSGLTPVAVNGSQSFLIAPDGSKEGWSNSDEGDERRAAYIEWLLANDTLVDWVAVNFGGDDADHIRARGKWDDDWRTAPPAEQKGGGS